jgi:hypothetical protein
MRGVAVAGVDRDVMRHSYKWAIKLSPRWVDGYYNLGNLLLATNQVEKAMERLQVAGVCRPVCPPVCSVCPTPPCCEHVCTVCAGLLSLHVCLPPLCMQSPPSELHACVMQCDESVA